MAWFIQPLEIADAEGKPTGRWRMTATSDEDGGGPFGDMTHDHESAEEAQKCERCDKYVCGVSGFPSARRQVEEMADMVVGSRHAHDPQDATTPVDGMDITEMLRDRAYATHKLCVEAAGEIDWLRARVKELEGKPNA